MCRYAFKEYKPHFACFECRKAFKKTAILDWARQKGIDHVFERLSRWGESKEAKRLERESGTSYEQIRDDYLREVASCPQCGKAMAAMGLDFRAPATIDEEAWSIIEILYEHGFAFHGCGCSVGYAPPTKVSGLPEFFAKHERLSEGEKLLAKIRALPK